MPPSAPKEFLKKDKLALLRLEVALVLVVLVVVDDLAEVDAREEVLVGLGHLEEHRIGLHVLDVGLDERSALLDDLDHFLLADDRLVDQGILGRRQLAPGHCVLVGLLLAEDRRSGQGRKRCGEEKRQTLHRRWIVYEKS